MVTSKPITHDVTNNRPPLLNPAIVVNRPYLLRYGAPTALLLALGIYILVGGTALHLIEHSYQRYRIDIYQQQAQFERQQYARFIASRIFNDTRQLMIIIDSDQSEKVHLRLVDALRRYETKLMSIIPASGIIANRWSLGASLNYVTALLTTIGDTSRRPSTVVGQLFVIGYALIGVPLFALVLFTIAQICLIPTFDRIAVRGRRIASPLTIGIRLVLVATLYIVWLLVTIALFEWLTMGSGRHRWLSTAFTIVTAMLTVDTSAFDAFDDAIKSMALVCVIGQLLIVALFILIAIRGYLSTTSVIVSTPSLQQFNVTVDDHGRSRLLAGDKQAPPQLQSMPGGIKQQPLQLQSTSGGIR